MNELSLPLSLEARLTAYDPVLAVPDLSGSPAADVTYLEYDGPVGRLVLAATPQALVACSYDSVDEVAGRLARLVSARVLRSGRVTAAPLDAVRRELDGYFAGRLRSFSVPVSLALAGPLGRDVLSSLGSVPYGRTTTYGAVAAAVGRPRAARAVGSALGANPLCIVLPCHRVLPASGAVGGYAGGAAAKRALLALEDRALPATPRGPAHT